MPRTKKVQAVESIKDTPPVEPISNNTPPPALTKEDYIKARATIKQFREEKKAKPKRQCSEKQLAALKAGRLFLSVP